MHAQRFFVHFQHGLFFGNVVLVAFAQRDDFAHNLDVIATALGFGHHLFLVIHDVFLFLLQTLKALNELTQFICGDAIAGIDCLLGHGASII